MTRRSSLNGSIFESPWSEPLRDGVPQTSKEWADWGDPWAEKALDLAEAEMDAVLKDAKERGLSSVETDAAMGRAARRIKEKVTAEADEAVPLETPQQPWVDAAIDAMVESRRLGYDVDRQRRAGAAAGDALPDDGLEDVIVVDDD